MRRIIVGFFAAIGLLVVGLIVLGIVLWLLAPPTEKPLAENNILLIDLSAPLADLPPDQGIERILLAGKPTLRDVLDGIARAGGDPRIKGIIAHIGEGATGTAEAEELRDAIAAFRAKGKFTLAYADSFGEMSSGMRSYYLATGFDEIWLQPIGEVGLIGLRVEMPFFRGALDKLGIEPRFDHRSEFKTAMNTLTETKMTPAHRQETEALLTSVFGQMADGIAAGRKLDPAQVRSLVNEGPFGTKEALDAHLIDHVGYRDDALAAARARAGENARTVSLSRYLDKAGHPHRQGPTIAVIYASGLITSGKSSSSPLSGSGILGADTLADAFREAAQDASVRAILFRINSPGGSATASETMWRAVRRAREAGKPIIVSMGDVAASGGYYIAVAADKIVAEPATLTGSIGVVSGKVLIGGLSDKLGITWDSTQIGDNAGMGSVVEDFTPAEHEKFERMLDYVYAGFKDRVAEGRKLSPDAVEQVARGRVWTGAEAQSLGLVDALGGFDTALALAKASAGIAADSDVTLKLFPPESNSPAAVIARLLGRETDDAGAQSAAADHVLAELRPLLRQLELAAPPPGALTMPPLELR
jgi:protease-4